MSEKEPTHAMECSKPKRVELSEMVLQNMIEKDLSQLEDGLTFIDHFVHAGVGVIDTLALDSDHRPVIIEYKAVEGKDEYALLQALSYANWIDKNPDTVLRFIQERRPDLGISSIGDVRIILVAPSFTPYTIEASQMVEPDVKLVKYVAFEHPSIGKWLYLEEVGKPKVTRVPKAYSIDYHFAGRYAAMRPIFDRLEKEARKLGEDVKVEPKASYIACRRHHNFAIIYVYTNKLEVGFPIEPPEPDPRAFDASKWGFTRIRYGITLKSEDDIDERFLKWLRASYEAS